MVKGKKEEVVEAVETVQELKIVTPNDLEWTDHVLGLLSDDEKISGNPTTDGLRRVFEIALNCSVISADTNVVQSPSPDNEKRATVVHTLSYVLNDQSVPVESRHRSVSGAADVFWGARAVCRRGGRLGHCQPLRALLREKHLGRGWPGPVGSMRSLHGR